MDNGYKKILFTITSLVAIIGYGYFVYAAAPNGGYAAGQTLDPDCAPGDTDCIVALSGGGGVPAGSNGQVQYNNNGVFGADSLFTRDPSTFNTYIGKDIETPLYEYVIDLGYRVSDHPYTGTFIEGETIVGDTSGATAIIQRIDSPVLMMSVTGTFQDGETVTGQTSAATTLYEYFPGIQSGDTILIIDIDTNASVGFGTVTNTTSTQATIETIAAVQNGNYMGTIVNGTFTNAVNTIANIVSQNEIDIIDGDTGISIGNTVDVLGGILTGTGSSLSSSSAPGIESQVFVGSILGALSDNSFSISAINENTDFATSLLGYTTTLGSAGLQISTGRLTNTGEAASIFLNASNDASDIIFTTGPDGNQIALFNQDGSIALGYSATVAGIDSLAFGQNAYTHGDSSIALGYGALTWSAFETSIGSRTTQYTPVSSSLWDINDRLFAIGNGDQNLLTDHNAYTLWKDGSFAYNDDNFQNDNSGTEQNMFYFNYGNHDGLGVAQTNKSVRLGSACDDIWDVNSGNVGDRSIAIGFALSGCAADGPTASGNNSLAIGRSTIASNQDALAIGTNAQATGEQSVAIGASSFAQGRYSIVLGSSITSSGEGSIGIGGYHTSSGHYSTAIGRANIAEGDFSTVLGTENFARSYAETTLGIFNTDYTAIDATVFESTDRLFSVGNGTGIGARSDAFTILKNGFTGIGYDNFETTALTALLQVNGDIQQTGATSCSLSADSDGMIICTPSDENLKTNINNLTYGLDTLSTLRPVSYTFKDVKYGTGNQIGFIAQELEQIIPEVVTNGPDYKSVNYGLLSSVIVKSIQEMNLKITDIDNMETPNTWRDALIAWFESTTNGIRKLFVGEVHTDTLCIGQTCVTESQLQQLLQNSPQVIYSIPDDNPPTEPDPETSDEPPVPELESNPGINEESPAPDVTDNAPTE